MIEHPAISPDLNPIENLFGLFDKKLRPIAAYKNADLLWKRIYECWHELNSKTSTLKNLMLSMRRRYNAVIKCKGEHTRY